VEETLGFTIHNTGFCSFLLSWVWNGNSPPVLCPTPLYARREFLQGGCVSNTCEVPNGAPRRGEGQGSGTPAYSLEPFNQYQRSHYDIATEGDATESARSGKTINVSTELRSTRYEMHISPHFQGNQIARNATNQ
jgi:hypothetical protein